MRKLTFAAATALLTLTACQKAEVLISTES